MKISTLKTLTLIVLGLALVSCGHSVTNVWDVYAKNQVAKYTQDSMTVTKTELLYRTGEATDKAQFEFVAFKQDTQKYLIIGSHTFGKTFNIQESSYVFNVKSLISKAKDEDYIRQVGELNVYFTHVPYEAIDRFLNYLPNLRASYKENKPASGGQTLYIDYQLSPQVIVSFPKDGNNNNPSDVILWVGKRKHEMSMSRLIDIMNEMRDFK